MKVCLGSWFESINVTDVDHWPNGITCYTQFAEIFGTCSSYASSESPVLPAVCSADPWIHFYNGYFEVYLFL